MSWPILLFGLSSGASAGAVLVITRFGDALGALTLPLSAFAGGVLSALAVMILFRVGRVRRAEQRSSAAWRSRFVQRAHQLPGVFRRSAGGRFGVVLVARRAGAGALG